MKKTFLFYALALCYFPTIFANITPLIKQGLAVSITPNNSYIRASDFDAGSFIEGTNCTMPIIFSFDANGTELTKEITACVGTRIIYIYMTNPCDPTDQAKVVTYLDVQNNLLLPNIPSCPDPTDAICADEPAVIVKPNNPAYPMVMAMQGIAVTPAAKQSTFLLNWNQNLNVGSNPNGGVITDKHIQINPSLDPKNNPIPTTWQNTIIVDACCEGIKDFAMWAKNTSDKSNYVTTYLDIQTPALDNPNQPIVYAYQGLATRYLKNKTMNIPAKVWNFGSYSPTNSALTFSYFDNDLNLKVDSAKLYEVKFAVKDATGNKNSTGTYLDVQKETLIMGATNLKSINTVSTYTMTENDKNYEWYLDNKLVASKVSTYITPFALDTGTHHLKVLKKSNNICVDRADLKIKVINYVATQEQEAIEMDIFPNPVKDYLNIRSNINDTYTIEISDIMGRILTVLEMSNSITQLDLSSLMPSIYTLKFRKKNEIIKVEKIVKE